MAAVEERKSFLELQEDLKQVDSTPAVDFSFIHWGYLNSTLVTDQSKKSKDLTWKTYWVDLCGSTLRLYRDLSLNPDSGRFPPPSKVIGPADEDEKKEAFLVLKKGASISIPNPEEFQHRRKNKKAESSRSNVFKLQVINSNSSPVYFFEAPSKGSMYRWISKLEEGIDTADNPKNQSVSDKKLKEAKLSALERRRYQTVAPELNYSDTKDDTDSGMEGDVEESIEFQEKPPPDPRLESLVSQLLHKQELFEMLERGEKAFIGERGELSKVCEFKATTKADYYLVPGFLQTLIPKATKINILGQLPNGRWRCYVDLLREKPLLDCTEVSRTSTCDTTTTTDHSERLIGSVPTSLVLELEEKDTMQDKKAELSALPMGTPDVTPSVSPCPSPPPPPYSPHKPHETAHEDSQVFVRRRTPTNLQRFVPSMDLSDVDAWEEFVIPSPPSTPVSSSSTSPSLSPCESMETLDASADDQSSERPSSELSNDIPVSYIGSAPDSEPPVVRLRKKDKKDVQEVNQADEHKNYSFLVTKKLRQRGISLIVGSSSSEDEDDFTDVTGGGYLTKITRRKLDQEFEQFAAENKERAVVRPYSAFVPRKTTEANFNTRPNNVKLRTATTDDLLKDYSSANRSKTCVTLRTLQGKASPENAPPINQRRTIQLSRNDKEGFGFTLQTYGILQQNGEVEYMTFILAVEDDGPAYMAGMRPGDIIISIENHDVEDANHTTLVSLLQTSPSTLRMVVVFVDAIRRMHLNTTVNVLSNKLLRIEEEFKDLCRAERELLTRSGDSGVLNGDNFNLFHPMSTGADSFLYATERTSLFSKDTRKVEDSIVKYKLEVDDRPRPTSLPDHSQLTKQGIISTTGTQLLKNFASSADCVLKKSASVKLKKKVQKTKQVSKTFRSYLDMDNEIEAPVATSSPKHDSFRQSRLSTSPSNIQKTVNRELHQTVGNRKASKLESSKSHESANEKPSKMSNSDSISQPVDHSLFPNPSDYCRNQSKLSEGKPRYEQVGDQQAHYRDCSPSETPVKDKMPESSSFPCSSEDKHSKVDFSETALTLPVCEHNSLQKTSNTSSGTVEIETKATNFGDIRKGKINKNGELKCESIEPNRNNTEIGSSDCGNAKVDWSRTNNIASLRKMFEPASKAKVEEETDVFLNDNCRKTGRPEFPRARLSSRPMSYMCAMDAAEDSPLIPEVDRQKMKKETSYESSA